MIKPNVEKYNPDPEYLRSLIAKSGLSIRKAAATIGVNERLMRMYLADRQSKSAQTAPYPIQFCLEVLAARMCQACGHVGIDWLDDGETCPVCKLVQ